MFKQLLFCENKMVTEKSLKCSLWEFACYLKPFQKQCFFNELIFLVWGLQRMMGVFGSNLEGLG